MKMKSALLAGAVALFFAVPAFANSPMVTKPVASHAWFFDKMDANHDGVVSKSEFLNDADKKFGWADKNNDGKISQAELSSVGAKHGTRTEQYHWSKTHRAAGSSSSMPPANNEVHPKDYHRGGADGAGGWTAQ